ncbi:MAG: hypothetical protein QW165_03580 [Candidatus Woesearchaeota archaeon]
MQWLKNLFKEKKTLEQAARWVQEKLEEKQKETNQAIATAEQEFPTAILEVKQALATLEQAELRNPNIPERAKHFMQGNRDQFIKLTSRFIENLFVPKDATDISQTDVLFHQYAQNTERPAAIVSEFFRDEIIAVRKALAEIEHKIQEIKKTQLSINQLQNIQKILDQITQVAQDRANIAKQRTEFEQQLQKLKTAYENIKKEKEDFTKKPEYLKVKEDLVGAVRERQEAEQALAEILLPLSDAIKKYAHDTKNQKLLTYAENPLEGLMHDYAFGILKHVPAIIEAITTGKIDLKPEKKQKALLALAKMNKETLGPMLHRYARAKKQETDMHHNIAQRPIMQEYENYAVLLKTKASEIQQLESTIAKLTLPTDDELRVQLKKELEKHNIVLI